MHPIKAVITGDIIDSSSFSGPERETLLKRLKRATYELSDRHDSRYTFFRGDSLQGLLDHPQEALLQALFLKASLKSLRFSEDHRTPRADIRLAIGIGSVEYLQERLEESDGEAFRLSGQALDQMKVHKQGLVIRSPWPDFNKYWEVITVLMDHLIDKWSVLSAETILELLQEKKEKEIAEKLGISQPAVNARKQAADWDAIHMAVQHFSREISNNLNSNEAWKS